MHGSFLSIPLFPSLFRYQLASDPSPQGFDATSVLGSLEVQEVDDSTAAASLKRLRWLGP